LPALFSIGDRRAQAADDTPTAAVAAAAALYLPLHLLSLVTDGAICDFSDEDSTRGSFVEGKRYHGHRQRQRCGG
jgi:hypothetical protein